MLMIINKIVSHATFSREVRHRPRDLRAKGATRARAFARDQRSRGREARAHARALSARPFLRKSAPQREKAKLFQPRRLSGAARLRP
jgi:hypothetical protein